MKQKLANLQAEIYRQRAAIVRKMSGLKKRNEHKVVKILRGYKDLEGMEVKAQKLGQSLRGQQQSS